MNGVLGGVRHRQRHRGRMNYENGMYSENSGQGLTRKEVFISFVKVGPVVTV